MATGRIISTGPLPGWAAELLGAEFELIVSPSARQRDIKKLLDSSCLALVARSSTPITDDLMEAAPKLRVIGRTGVGYDSVDVKAATRRGIAVLYTPDALTRPTAEHGAALILAAAKNLGLWQQLALQGEWGQRNQLHNQDLKGSLLGLIGLGRIGREVHRLLRPFEMRVLACDPYLEPGEMNRLGVESCTLEALLCRADIVSLHLPLTPQTAGIINSRNINTLKPGAVLVNTARGGLIESNAILWQALQKGRLASVALDTLEEEPPDPGDPLLAHPRALITAHVGSRTPQAQRQVVQTLVEDLTALLRGESPRARNLINPEVLETGGNAETSREGRVRSGGE